MWLNFYRVLAAHGFEATDSPYKRILYCIGGFLLHHLTAARYGWRRVGRVVLCFRLLRAFKLVAKLLKVGLESSRLSANLRVKFITSRVRKEQHCHSADYQA
jgi:hypothetical protein